MTSAECKAYLVENMAKLVDERFRGSSGDDTDYGKWRTEVCANARKPMMWKRRAKYHLGSLNDVDGVQGYCGGGGSNYAKTFGENGVVREFTLEGSDGVAFALIEVDNKIVHVDDLCD